MPLAGVLDSEIVEPELLGQAVQLAVVGILDVDPRGRVDEPAHIADARLGRYQCTPRMMWARATASVEAFCSGCFSPCWMPRAAGESGKTL